ncbi:MAG: hypothetical protein ACXWLH_05190 [Candidatus Saccharimonadales bacterium]
MKKQQLPTFTSIETNDEFKSTPWPEIFGRWAVIAQGSEIPQKELLKQWQNQINGIDEMFVDRKRTWVNFEDRALLTAMGLVQVRKLPLRDKIGFTLFAPDTADYYSFANRVEFTEQAIEMLNDPVPVTPYPALEAPSGNELPESF